MLSVVAPYLNCLKFVKAFKKLRERFNANLYFFSILLKHFGAATLSITTFSIMDLLVTLSAKDTQHKHKVSLC
jgi:hypothetical protein